MTLNVVSRDCPKF